jgi:hypothetical protein
MNFFDLVLAIAIVVLTNYAFKQKKFKLLYAFVREIFIFATATKYAFFVSSKLILWHILSHESTLGVQLLIGFGVSVFSIIFVVRLVEYIFFMLNKGKYSKLTYVGNALVVTLSVVIIVSVSAFVLMQITFVKKYSQNYVNKSKSYSHIDKYYSNLLSTKFVKTTIIARSPSLEIIK